MDKPYILLDLEQGSPEWLSKRREYGTSSETPSIMGIPTAYQTRAQLIDEKLTGKVADLSSFKQHLFQQGHDAELAARGWLENHLKLKFPPAVIVSNLCPDLLASLDGLCEEKNLIFEAKFMGEKALTDVKAGVIKPHHECQVQAQLLASGASKCIYFATTKEGHSAILEIKPDPEYARRIAVAVTEFMEGVRQIKARTQELEQLREGLERKYLKHKRSQTPLKTLPSGAKDPFQVRVR